MITRLYVLYDAQCPTCVRAKTWLEQQVQLIPIQFVAAGSAEARQQFPSIDHARSLREVTAIGNDGSVYYKDRASIVVLWALARWRDVADHMASPWRRPFVRAVVGLVNGWRLFSKRRHASPGIYRDTHARQAVLPPSTFGRGPSCDADRCG